MSTTTTVYAIQRGGQVKMGKANDPTKRLKQLQTGQPDTLKLLGFVEIPADEGLEMEARLHAELDRHHHRGEWFTITKTEALEVLAEITCGTGTMLRRHLAKTDLQAAFLVQFRDRLPLGPIAEAMVHDALTTGKMEDRWVKALAEIYNANFCLFIERLAPLFDPLEDDHQAARIVTTVFEWWVQMLPDSAIEFDNQFWFDAATEFVLDPRTNDHPADRQLYRSRLQVVS